ncbi:MAG: type II toxin-antitoxin system RelE/ParE family toxin [Bacteroidales bacterium]|nr:type II toxin-antitoxin system RelE/ParE family toxin [Bacteroidales bacterium]MCF8338155.1 type II toxin-antitoxin system RelE/ParE family toxin [Bacteroidales bacterium]
MNYRVDTTENFEREAKKLIKKYKSLKDEIDELIDSLQQKPFEGIHLGNNVYKIRLKVKSKGKGKRGGARVITKVKIVDEMVYLFSIYSKGEKDDISDSEIQDLLKDIP